MNKLLLLCRLYSDKLYQEQLRQILMHRSNCGYREHQAATMEDRYKQRRLTKTNGCWRNKAVLTYPVVTKFQRSNSSRDETLIVPPEDEAKGVVQHRPKLLLSIQTEIGLTMCRWNPCTMSPCREVVNNTLSTS